MPAKTVTLRHLFAGGWATDFGPTAEVALQGGVVRIPFLVDAENVFYELDGAPHKVGGTEKLNAVVVEGGEEIRGLFDFWRQPSGASPANYRVIHAGTKVLADNNDGTFAPIITGLEDDVIPGYCAFDDLLIVTSSSNNDFPSVWDATTVTELSSAPKFSFCVVHKNRVWAAGDLANPSLLYYSAAEDPTDWTGGDTGSIVIDPGDGDRITGLISHKDNLFVFKGPHRGSVHRISGSSPAGSDPFARSFFASGVPLAWHNALFRFRDDVGYLGADGTVRSLAATAAFGDFIEASLSRPIHTYLAHRLTHSQLSRSWVKTDAANGRVVFAVPADTATRPNRMVVMDYRFDPVRWSLWTFPSALGCPALEYVIDTTDSNRPALWFGGNDGFIRRMDRETRSIDAATAISAVVRTPHLHYGTPHNKKTFYTGSVGISPQGSANLTVKYQRDDRTEQEVTVEQSGGDILGNDALDPNPPYFLLDTSMLGGARFIHRFFDMEGEFRSAAYRFQQTEVNRDMELHSFGITLKQGADSAENA